VPERAARCARRCVVVECRVTIAVRCAKQKSLLPAAPCPSPVVKASRVRFCRSSALRRGNRVMERGRRHAIAARPGCPEFAAPFIPRPATAHTRTNIRTAQAALRVPVYLRADAGTARAPRRSVVSFSRLLATLPRRFFTICSPAAAQMSSPRSRSRCYSIVRRDIEASPPC